MQQLLQIATTLLQNATFITNCDSTDQNKSTTDFGNKSNSNNSSNKAIDENEISDNNNNKKNNNSDNTNDTNMNRKYKKIIFTIGNSMVRNINNYGLSKLTKNMFNGKNRFYLEDKIRCMEDHAKSAVRSSGTDQIVGKIALWWTRH